MFIILLHVIIPDTVLFIFVSFSLSQLKVVTGLISCRDRQLISIMFMRNSLLKNILNGIKTCTEVFCQHLAILMFHICFLLISKLGKHVKIYSSNLKSETYEDSLIDSILI